MWDNASRRKYQYFAFYNSSPELFGKWLNSIVNKFIPYSQDENFIFINAWNEWAEGNHLEPDMKWGKAYLDELKRIVNAIIDDGE
jgi:lipopolysaccharide biosynthesis protein